MAEHSLYLSYSMDSYDALSQALDDAGMELSDENYNTLIQELPFNCNLTVYFDDEDIPGTFDIVDQDMA